MTVSPSAWFQTSRILAIGVLAFLVLPALIVVPVSLTDTTWLALPQETVSFDHWRTLLSEPVWRDSMVRSLAVAIASTACSVVIGTLAAIGCRNLVPEIAGRLRLLLLLPMIVPGVVAGLAWYRVFIPLGLIDTYAGVILAHGVSGIPLVFVTVSSALAAFDARLEQAARSLGAGTGMVLRRVLFPAALPGVLSGAVFAFIASWDEVVVLLFITSRNVYLLPRAIWDGINENVDPAIAAAATLMIVVTVAGLLLVQLFGRDGEKG
ncbi:ABC transporter permease [Phreatobacter stygius]|uniref:ABC transporter permease n=1 Tax=Phreatobacter stygius TaxID=1940610 RepID=A0A4D7B6V7_9HYPH|nr:ABC transporter permease [Phreatobacter stygius]QCI66108.1 ABC transporter permease [Phreatobacter stygius]